MSLPKALIEEIMRRAAALVADPHPSPIDLPVLDPQGQQTGNIHVALVSDCVVIQVQSNEPGRILASTAVPAQSFSVTHPCVLMVLNGVDLL